MNELIVHSCIADFCQSIGVPVNQDIDFTMHAIADLHPSPPYKSPTFRAEYFSFVFIKKGAGWSTIDGHRFRVRPRLSYFTNPGHIKSFEIEEMHEGYIITMSEAFLRENVHQDIFEAFPFLLSETMPPQQHSPETFANFEALYLQLYKEYQGNSPYRAQLLGNMFVVILLKLKELHWQAYDPLKDGQRDSEIVKNFRRLVEKHFVDLTHGQEAQAYQVQDYARLLNLHPNYLSQVIKNKTGHTVHHYITQRQVSTARSLLKNTRLSAKQISQQLGFSEPTHFSRFFKKHTGHTPNNFRKQPA